MDNLWRPERMSTDSPTFSMAIAEWEECQLEQTSAVHRVGGYPWRLQLTKCSASNDKILAPGRFCGCRIELICDKSKEAHLWTCSVTPTLCYPGCAYALQHFDLKSWNVERHSLSIPENAHYILNERAQVLVVEVKLDNDGETWRSRSVIGPDEPLDGILVIGADKKKIRVNKKTLAEQSSFFDRLFFGDFKERDMTEIPIKDVEYGEFSNLLKMVYEADGFFLMDENVHVVLQLADRFDLKIVEDVCVNYLLSSSSSFTIHDKLLISEKYNLRFLRDRLIKRYSARRRRVIVPSPSWESLSSETIKELVKKGCGLIRPSRWSSESSS